MKETLDSSRGRLRDALNADNEKRDTEAKMEKVKKEIEAMRADMNRMQVIDMSMPLLTSLSCALLPYRNVCC